MCSCLWMIYLFIVANFPALPRLTLKSKYKSEEIKNKKKSKKKRTRKQKTEWKGKTNGKDATEESFWKWQWKMTWQTFVSKRRMKTFELQISAVSVHKLYLIWSASSFCQFLLSSAVKSLKKVLTQDPEARSSVISFDDIFLKNKI